MFSCSYRSTQGSRVALRGFEAVDTPDDSLQSNEETGFGAFTFDMLKHHLSNAGTSYDIAAHGEVLGTTNRSPRRPKEGREKLRF
jgi:hypothetical protein